MVYKEDFNDFLQQKDTVSYYFTTILHQTWEFHLL